jgi:hypothetical protein
VTLVGAIASAESYGLVDVGLRARINLSYAAAAEDPQMAFEVVRDGVALVRHLGMAGYGGYMLGNAAAFAAQNGEFEWAIATLEETLADFDQDYAARFRLAQLRGLQGADVDADFAAVAERVAGSTEIQIQATVDEGMAMVELARGNFQRALELAKRSYERNVAPDSESLPITARAAAWLGEEAALRAVIDLLVSQPGRLPAAARREAEASMAALQGRRSEAATGFADAIRRWRELGLHVDVAWCALSWVTLLGSADPAARAAAEEARALFERIGARPLLSLLERAMTAAAAVPAGSAPPVAASVDREA